MKTRTKGFTMIEIMITISIIFILASLVFVMVKGADTNAKNARLQMEMKTLGDAINAFKQSTGSFPLAVPYDAWLNNHWDGANSFTLTVGWSVSQPTKWTNYFKPDNATALNGKPDFQWDAANIYPTDIQMLTFQLEQVPESNTILTRIKETSGSSSQKQVEFTPTSSYEEKWTPTDKICQLGHPLDITNNLRRNTFQPLDPWGTPLRYWTADTLKWAKSAIAAWDGNGGTTGQPIIQLLSEKLQKANWGFFIESAGPDRTFGWYGSPDSIYNASQAEDNVYSVK